MLRHQYDKTASTKRLQLEPGTDKKSYQDHLPDVPCLIQPLDATLSADVEMSYGKNFLMMCDVTDIIEGDRIFIDEEEYRIMAVETLEFMGESHMELSIRIFKP